MRKYCVSGEVPLVTDYMIFVLLFSWKTDICCILVFRAFGFLCLLFWKSGACGDGGGDEDDGSPGRLDIVLRVALPLYTALFYQGSFYKSPRALPAPDSW